MTQETTIAKRMRQLVDEQLERVMFESIATTASNVTPPTPNTLTKQRLDKLMDDMCPLKPRYAAFVVRKDMEHQLKLNSATPPSPAEMMGIPPSFAGIPIYTKPGQICPAIAFANHQQAIDYLDGKITEKQLISGHRSHATTP